MTPHEYSQFIAWARQGGGTDDLIDRFEGTLSDVQDVRDYLALAKPPGGDE
jgi:hypothetical protein